MKQDTTTSGLITANRQREKMLEMADRIIGQELMRLNEGAIDCLTATQVAKTFNMPTRDFNRLLAEMGILFRRQGRWHLVDELQGRDLGRIRTHVSYSLMGQRKVKTYLTWTLKGLHYLNSRLGYPNF